MEISCFVVIVFPAEKEPKKVAELATRIKDGLKKACGDVPTMIRPDLTAMCLLVDGEFGRISRALQEAVALDTRYFVAKLEKPYASAGLSTAHQWLQTRI